MQKIHVEFPMHLDPKKIVYLLVNRIRQCNPDVQCSCIHSGQKNGQNIFDITATSPMAFFYAGAASAAILNLLDDVTNKKSIAQFQSYNHESRVRQ